MFSSGKRYREEDDDELEILRADHKKPRNLPFRTSPTTKHNPLFFSQTRHVPKPPVLTPAESSDEDSFHDRTSPSNKASSLFTSNSIMNIDYDSDCDMTDSQPLGSPKWSPKTMSPPVFSPSQNRLGIAEAQRLSSTDNTRIPTPIYGHFNAIGGLGGTIDSPIMTSFPGKLRSRSSTLDSEAQHDLYLRRRRLPSPISEHDVDSPTSMAGGMLRDLDMSATTPSTSQFPSHDMMAPLTPTVDMMMHGENGGLRRRADAIIGCEGRKVVFTMGFRADCDKCRERVPGHYNHVLRV